MVIKPADMFDRDAEWSALTRFVLDEQPGATLGVVSGRRRQGKTYLLDAVCHATGGFYFGATEASDSESLRRIGDALTEYLRPLTPFRPADWYEAVDALLAIGHDHPVPVVLDEFPYLVKAAPALPSIIQQAFGPLRQQRTASRTRLLLCGSAMSFMGRLLSGSAPLRGRAGLEIVVHALDYRQAAKFWGISDPRLAVRVNAIVGGTPAYRREFVRGDTPANLGDFDNWVTRTVLDPASPLFREARYLLAEEPDTRDTALYHSVLAAVAEGNSSRGGIANFLGRPASDIGHHLNVLEDSGLLVREPDAFRKARTTYRIAEPLLAFYGAVMRPTWSRLERPGAADQIWRISQNRYTSNVLGPRFEQLCREYGFVDPARILGDAIPAQVSSGTVNDAARRTSHEVDVVVTGVADGGPPPLLAIGEAKWGETMDLAHLERLRRIRDLIAGGGRFDISRTKLVCYSGTGFTSALRAAATNHEVTLVGLDELYCDVPPSSR